MTNLNPRRNSYPQIQCKQCGIVGEAMCDCGADYIAVIEEYQEKDFARREKDRQRKIRDKAKTSTKSNNLSAENDSNVVPFDPIQEPCDDCKDNEERWQRSLQNFASDAVAMRAMWKRHFDSWESFTPSKQTISLAEQAANEWAEIVRQLKLRKR